MIRLSNGHEFRYMAASGALAFDGRGWPWEQPLRWVGLLDPRLFTVVIKTLTLKPRKGNLRWYNPGSCIRLIKDGAVNAVGLTNPGIHWWCRKVGPEIDLNKVALMGSILGTLPELVQMAKMLNDFDLMGLELNASCPNTGCGVLDNTNQIIESCQAVKDATRFPLIIKLSVVHDVRHILEGLQGGVEAISINSVPWKVVFPDKASPLTPLGGGGVSGRVVQVHTWDLVKRLVRMTEIPVIGPSVWDFHDIYELRGIGARAVSFGSIFLRYPWRPTLYVREDEKRRQMVVASQIDKTDM